MKFNSFLYEKTKTIVFNIGYIWVICFNAIVERTSDNLKNNIYEFTPTIRDPTFRFSSPETFPPRLETIQQIENRI
jgi:hypothetical protein